MVEHLSDRQATTVLTGRLAEILDAVDSGVTVLDADLRLVYVNQAAASLCGWSTPEEMLAASASETLARFELLDEAGDPVSPAVLPGRRVLAGEDPEPMVLAIPGQGDGRGAVVDRPRPRDRGRVRAAAGGHDVQRPDGAGPGGQGQPGE